MTRIWYIILGLGSLHLGAVSIHSSKAIDNSKSTRYARSLLNPIYENKTSIISSKQEEPEAVVSNFVANWVYTPRSRPTKIELPSGRT
jgi:hypothetical protein